jgi:prepilin-type N-terminal cleavage/methylation domain-containing protein
MNPHTQQGTAGRGRSRAFTLIELLAVITIGAILLSVAGGAYLQARNHTKRVRAQTQLRELCKAWTAYWLAYQSWPSSVLSVNGGVDVPMSVDTMRALHAKLDDGSANTENPRGIAFVSMNVLATDRNYPYFTDPWDHPYKITFSQRASANTTALRIAVGFPNRDRYK